jgi:hypothetical protein
MKLVTAVKVAEQSSTASMVWRRYGVDLKELSLLVMRCVEQTQKHVLSLVETMVSRGCQRQTPVTDTEMMCATNTRTISS